jgi:hypothetical protein
VIRLLLGVLFLLADRFLRAPAAQPTPPAPAVTLIEEPPERVVLCGYARTEEEWETDPPEDDCRAGWRQFRPARLPRLRRRPGTLSTGGPSGRPYPDRHTGVTLPGWRTT